MAIKKNIINKIKMLYYFWIGSVVRLQKIYHIFKKRKKNDEKIVTS